MPSEHDDLARAIDGRDLAHHHARIALAPEQVAYRPGDVGGRETGGRDLVEQRLEQVVILAIDERDVGVEAAKTLGDGEAAESGPDDDDASFCHVTHCH